MKMKKDGIILKVIVPLLCAGIGALGGALGASAFNNSVNVHVESGNNTNNIIDDYKNVKQENENLQKEVTELTSHINELEEIISKNSSNRIADDYKNLEQQNEIFQKEIIELKSQIKELEESTNKRDEIENLDLPFYSIDNEIKQFNNKKIVSAKDVKVISKSLASLAGSTSSVVEDTMGNTYISPSIIDSGGHIEYYTNGKYNTLLCTIAPRIWTFGSPSAYNEYDRKIIVYTDDSEIYTSPDWITYKTEPYTISLDITNAKSVKIECISTGSAYVGVILGDLKFSCNEN